MPHKAPISILFSLFISAVWTPYLQAQAEFQTTDPLRQDTIAISIYPDDPVLAALDALWAEERLHWQCFEGDTVCLNAYGFTWNEVPSYSDAELAARIAYLNERTPLDLRYNKHVKGFINLYTHQRRDVTARVLGLAALYYPMFEEKLDMFDMPLELKHLAVVESALNPSARSKVGATGLWQFMYTTGRMFGLEVDSYYDDRRDPLRSTIAACRYMKYLYGIYGDWNLVLAAYNSGPGNVNKAIRRSGGKKDYWSILEYLPRETRGYVPAFIAVNYVMNYATEHNLYPVKPSYLFSEIDTVHVCGPARLEQIAFYTGIGINEVSLLNPSIRRGEIPPSEKCKPIYLPVNAIGTYLANRDSMHQYTPPVAEIFAKEVDAPQVSHVHTVKSGETLGVIAQRNKVSVSQIKQWNNLRSDNIQPGQKLQMRAPSGSTNAQQSAAAKQIPSASGSKVHIVQQGDTLWDIARKYPGVSLEQLKKANSHLNFNNLTPGQKITIPST